MKLKLEHDLRRSRHVLAHDDEGALMSALAVGEKLLVWLEEGEPLAD